MLSFRLAVSVFLFSAAVAHAQPILDIGRVPYLNEQGRAVYATFLLANLPRAVAIAPGGAIGWSGGTGTLGQARQAALASCGEKGALDCRIYAENLDVVWQNRAPEPHPVPGPLIETWNYAFVPDERFFWRGPGLAAGLFVWSHGKSSQGHDLRGAQPPPYVRAFNNAGFDVVRFDRWPLADEPNRAAGWLRDALPKLRGLGWRVIVAGGQSRGAWTSLQILNTPGLADAIIAISPAAHGSGGSLRLLGQTDDFRRMLEAAAPSHTRVAFVQFQGDLYMGSADARRDLLEQTLRSKVGALLIIDQPPGFMGHEAGNGLLFAQRYGSQLLRFVLWH
ncbi:MAG: hypothetical protein JOY71_00420 [Acetobacteraceae bacterium]|nr:hypothetical protein [Acetobacteraceae bacterium]